MSGSVFEYISTTGVIVPNVSELQSDVASEWTSTFGTGLNTDSSTPQGVIIASDVAARTEVVNNNAALANQINPTQAEGVFLDAICALTGLEREANTFSTVTLTLAGVAGSPIPATTSQATSPNGDIFALNTDVTLSAGGTASAIFTALVAGTVAAPNGTYTPSAVLGWETAVAAAAGTVGTATQADEALRTLRSQTLFLQGVALMGATLSAVNNLPGVLSSQGLENYENTQQVIQTITLVANSIWVCVDGGAQANIANALLANKSQGANWNGATVTDVVEPTSGQTYVTKYDVPTPVPLLVQVTASQGAYTGNPASDIPIAAAAFAANQVDGLTGFVLGQNASPFEMAAGIQTQLPGIYLKSVQFSNTGTVSYAPTEIAIAINEKATVIAANVSVVLV